MRSGFDFIDFWAIDFDWKPGEPFHHDWQDYRTRKDRSLKTVSDAGHVYDNSGKHTICVKVVDVFGCDTSITIEVKTRHDTNPNARARECVSPRRTHSLAGAFGLV